MYSCSLNLTFYLGKLYLGMWAPLDN